MRTHAKGLLGAALFIIGVCFLFSMSCSWDILTQGDIQKEDASIAEALEILPVSVIQIIRRSIGTGTEPDSIWFKIESQIVIDDTLYDFVEMEVGELEVWDRSSYGKIITDHVPTNE